MAQIGFEASGPFDTYFVCFAGKPYAVTQATGESGTTIDVMQFGPFKSLCSFSPN